MTTTSKRAWLRISCAAAVLVAGCPGPDTTETDAGAGTDAPSPTDASGGTDAGPGGTDAGSGGTDAGPGGLDAADAPATDAGASSWREEAALLAAGGATDDVFGSSVAFSSDGRRALVGAYGDDIGRGSARVFLRTGTSWAEEATLLAVGGAEYDWFGSSVALSSDGSRALVGAARDDTAGGMDAGSARVFLRTGTSWAEEATLLAAGGLAFDYFGSSVALSSDGSRALVGADRGAGVGSARVFLRTGTIWAEEATLLAADGATGDVFGASVAFSSDGSRALVGAHYDDTAGGPNAGSARVFLLSP